MVSRATQIRRRPVADRISGIGWLIAARIIIYGCASGLVLINYRFRPEMVHSPVWVLGALALLTSINCLFFFNSLQSRLLLRILFILDVMLVTWLTAINGGYESNFLIFYFLIILVTPVWLTSSDTGMSAALSTLGIAWVGMAHLAVNPSMPGTVRILFPTSLISSMSALDPLETTARMLTLTVAFFITAYFGGLMGERLSIERDLNTEIMAAIDEGVAVFGASGGLIFANSIFFRLFPTINILPGMAASKIFAEKKYAAIVDVLSESDGDRAILSIEPVTRDESPMEVRVGKLKRERGQLTGWVVMVADLSLRRRVEDAERLAARFSAVSEMAAGLAHEIRNPLASIRSAIQEIGSSLPAEGSQKKLMTVVISEADRLNRIVGDFLSFARERTPRLMDCRTKDLLEKIVFLLERNPAAAKVKISLDCPENTVFKSDGEQLTEVFLNLGLNAAQAMDGEGTLTIECRRRRRPGGGEGIMVVFGDTGPGIPEDNLEKLFDPFFTTRAAGTGLGLPISRRIIEEHGGDIRVENIPGGGSEFIVWLPLAGPLDLGKTKARFRARRVFYADSKIDSGRGVAR